MAKAPSTPRRATLRASLWDRLIDFSPRQREEYVALRAQTLPELRESVRRDVEQLLSTRCPTPARLREARGRTVHDYGLQDVLHLAPSDGQARHQIAAAVREALETYEGRLRQVRVSVEPHPTRVDALWITVDAVLATDAVHEPFSFPFVVYR